MSGILFFIFASCHPLNKHYVEAVSVTSEYPQYGVVVAMTSVLMQDCKFAWYITLRLVRNREHNEKENTYKMVAAGKRLTA